MTSKKKLILVASKTMDGNKKESRNENGLIRMAAKARKYMDFNDSQVEIWPGGSTEERKQNAVLLDIFHAFSGDVTRLKKMTQSGELKTADLNRVGFVTTKMFNRITGGDKQKNIWISTGVHDTVMGCDPEFLLFNSNGEVVKANNISGMSKTSKIGYDGAMAEVRPDPSTTPDGLVINIKKCFTDTNLTRPISGYDWHAGCYYKDNSRDYPMGGHIHVGNPAKVARMKMVNREAFFNVLNKIMDELIAVPCVRLDGDMGTKRRTQCSMGRFGFFGEWRPHNGRLEHRTLSGMWLLHPTLAKCVIGTAKAITDEVFKRWAHEGFEHSYVIPSKYKGYNRNDMNDTSFNGWKEFELCKDLDATMTSGQLKKILDNSKGGDIDRKYLNAWHAKMKRLTTYPQYSKYIDGLKEILSISLTEMSKWDRKIQNNWLKSKKFIVNV